MKNAKKRGHAYYDNSKVVPAKVVPAKVVPVVDYAAKAKVEAKVVPLVKKIVVKKVGNKFGAFQEQSDSDDDYY